MKNTLLLLICLLPILGFSQKRKTDKHWEIGLNSTQLLRNLFAQNPTGLIGDYTFFIKKGANNNFFRAHFGGHIVNKEESFSGLGQFLTSKNTDLRIGLGFERRRTIYNKLQLVWGGDVLPSYTLDESVLKSFVSNTSKLLENKKEIYGVGAGPIIGLRYSFSQHFSISTESSLYVFFSESKNVTREDGVQITSKNFSKFSVSHTLPNSLFVVMNF